MGGAATDGAATGGVAIVGFAVAMGGSDRRAAPKSLPAPSGVMGRVNVVGGVSAAAVHAQTEASAASARAKVCVCLTKDRTREHVASSLPRADHRLEQLEPWEIAGTHGAFRSDTTERTSPMS